jgi:hypothetical protein
MTARSVILLFGWSLGAGAGLAQTRRRRISRRIGQFLVRRRRRLLPGVPNVDFTKLAARGAVVDRQTEGDVASAKAVHLGVRALTPMLRCRRRTRRLSPREQPSDALARVRAERHDVPKITTANKMAEARAGAICASCSRRFAATCCASWAQSRSGRRHARDLAAGCAAAALHARADHEL